MILHVAKASHRVYVFCTQAPNGDFDNLYLDMNGRSAMAGSMVHCKDNAFTQALCKVRTDPTLMDMVQELFTRAAIQKMVPRQWTRNTCILTTASQLVSRYEGIFSQQIQCHGHLLVCIQQSRYENIFLYLDRLFRIVRLHFMTLKLSINTGMSVALTRTARPKRLVYMAIDGVAPRTLLRLYKLLLETVSFDKGWLSRDIRPGLNHVCWRSQDEPAACSAVPSSTGGIILQIAGALVEECISPFIQERAEMEREQEKLRQDWEALSFSAASLHF